MAVPIALKCKFHLNYGEKIIQDFIMRGMAVPIASLPYHLDRLAYTYHFLFKTASLAVLTEIQLFILL